MTNQQQVNSSSAGAVVPPAPPSPTETDFQFTLDGQCSDAAGPPQYLFEFPDFGLLDVQLPDGFVDQSWHGNTCPSFELAAQDASAEWPQFTLFIDYLTPILRHEPDAPRFHLYRDADLEKPVIQSDLWSDVLTYVSQHRVPGVL